MGTMKLPLLLLPLLFACSETGLGSASAQNDAWPDIVVSPGSLDFGAVPLDGQARATIEVQNVGNAALTVSGVSFSGDPAFSLAEDVGSIWIAAGDRVEIPLQYTPVNQADAGWATIHSDDVDEPDLPVALAGRGAFPQLTISPSPVQVGNVELCQAGQRDVVFSNSGEDDLALTQLLLAGEGLELLDAPTLPLDLAPGESVEATVAFTPLRTGGVAGELWAASSDPAGDRQAAVSATGVVGGEISRLDSFRQPDGPWERSDILFFVDRSCSMKDDEANLVANIAQLADELDDSASDWQMMVTIDDNGCHEGDFLTPDTADLTGSFAEMLSAAPGRFKEAGLTIVANGVERAIGGGCNNGFLRSDSKTLLVTVSDEPEQSPDPWESYVSRIQAAAPSAAVIAVVGDPETGCATAEPGTGYIEAAEATGGEFLSVCAADWGRYFDVVGALATEGPRDSFSLSATPLPSSIQVTVDGLPDDAWTYDPVDNSVTLDLRPAPLARIEISYDLWVECPDEGDTGG